MMRLTGCIVVLGAAIATAGCYSEDHTHAVPDDAKQRAIAAKEALFTRLSGRLKEVMQSAGPVKAIEVCSQEANEIAQAVSKEQKVKIGRTSHRLRNPGNQPPAWARKLIAEKPGEPRFVEIDAKTTGALLPIKLQARCLMCHGEEDKLAPGVSEQLARLYPEDQATGFKEGDLRGWFWVEAPVEAEPEEASPKIESEQAMIQYGKMHEVIGQKKHHGRVELANVARSRNVYAVGAIEGLSGEVTLVDSQVVATQVNNAGEISTAGKPGLQATLLIGRSVAQWKEFTVESDVAPGEFDAYLARIAEENSVDLSKPAMFTIEGEFSDCCFHVINGACPVHAELHGVEMADGVKPYKTTQARIRGKLVGVYARNAAGVITHPGTSTHTHIVFHRGDGPVQLTAHVEATGIVAGSVLRFPAPE